MLLNPHDKTQGQPQMKKPSSKIREEIAKLQEQLKHAETREAERIGRIALKAGIAEIDIEEADLQEAFEELAKRFRGGKVFSKAKERAGAARSGTRDGSSFAPGPAPGSHGEA
ncbi:hypothetical protein N185_17495 [Sinorhizobium sp. GW3]|nr:hypothetical protein N185_17495 [Sinorhizobium sp. GW3]